MSRENIQTLKNLSSNIKSIVNNAIDSVKESYEKGRLEREARKGKESPEELLDLVRIYGGLIGMVDAGAYLDQIKKDPQNAKASVFLMVVFKQFPVVEERFKKFINENQG